MAVHSTYFDSKQSADYYKAKLKGSSTIAKSSIKVKKEGGRWKVVYKDKQENPSNLASKLRKGIRGTVRIVGKGKNRRLEIKT